MRLAPIDPLVSSAEGTNIAFNFSNEPKSPPALLAAGPGAYGALHATLGHGTVTVSNGGLVHGTLALQTKGQTVILNMLDQFL